MNADLSCGINDEPLNDLPSEPGFRDRTLNALDSQRTLRVAGLIHPSAQTGDLLLQVNGPGSYQNGFPDTKRHLVLRTWAGQAYEIIGQAVLRQHFHVCNGETMCTCSIGDKSMEHIFPGITEVELLLDPEDAFVFVYSAFLGWRDSSSDWTPDGGWLTDEQSNMNRRSLLGVCREPFTSYAVCR